MRRLPTLIAATLLLASLGCASGGGGAVVPDREGSALQRWLAAKTDIAPAGSGLTLTISIDPITQIVTVTCGDQVISTAPATP